MIPEFPEFKKLELADKEAVGNFTKDFPPYSDFNFVSMWSWDIKGEMRLSELNKNLVVLFTDYLTGEPFYSFIGNKDIESTVRTLIAFSSQNNLACKLKLVPEEVAQLITNDSFTCLPDQDNFDYVYDTKLSYECRGKDYETQRNMINRFNKKHEGYEVRVVEVLNEIKDDILSLDQGWKNNKVEKNGQWDFEHEHDALRRIFDVQSGNLFAVCIFHEGKLVAFCINELIPGSDFATAHFSKADVALPGIYSFLLNQTCKALCEKGVKYLNYEQDLGLPALRYSKGAFRPAHFLKKYTLAGR